ncbi:MAG TPA: hypothetical protein VI248_04810, partial [Kineosporiaceae bacterium]
MTWRRGDRRSAASGPAAVGVLLLLGLVPAQLVGRPDRSPSVAMAVAGATTPTPGVVPPAATGAADPAGGDDGDDGGLWFPPASGSDPPGPPPDPAGSAAVADPA